MTNFRLPLTWQKSVFKVSFCLFYVDLLFVHCYPSFSIVFTIEHNPMLGSHIGGWLGSSEPSIHAHLLAVTNIAAKANVSGTAERNHLSNIATGNLQCYTSQQGSMHDLFIKSGPFNVELSCFFMLVDDNLVPDGHNRQLDPYFIKLIVQCSTGSLGKECKSFITANPVFLQYRVPANPNPSYCFTYIRLSAHPN